MFFFILAHYNERLDYSNEIAQAHSGGRQPPLERQSTHFMKTTRFKAVSWSGQFIDQILVSIRLAAVVLWGRSK